MKAGRSARPTPPWRREGRSDGKRHWRLCQDGQRQARPVWQDGGRLLAQGLRPEHPEESDGGHAGQATGIGRDQVIEAAARRCQEAVQQGAGQKGVLMAKLPPKKPKFGGKPKANKEYGGLPPKKTSDATRDFDQSQGNVETGFRQNTPRKATAASGFQA